MMVKIRSDPASDSVAIDAIATGFAPLRPRRTRRTIRRRPARGRPGSGLRRPTQVFGPDLGRRAVFPLDRLVNLLAMHRDVRRSRNPDAYLVTSYVDDRDLHIVPDHDRFIALSRKHQHRRLLPWPSRFAPRSPSRYKRLFGQEDGTVYSHNRPRFPRASGPGCNRGGDTDDASGPAQTTYFQPIIRRRIRLRRGLHAVLLTGWDRAGSRMSGCRVVYRFSESTICLPVRVATPTTSGPCRLPVRTSSTLLTMMKSCVASSSVAPMAARSSALRFTR